MDPSGIRFGTPAITTRRFDEKQCTRVAELMIETLRNRKNAKKLKEVRAEIKRLCARRPIPERFV
jgi:glycine hydroxymethyltransferase